MLLALRKIVWESYKDLYTQGKHYDKWLFFIIWKIWVIWISHEVFNLPSHIYWLLGCSTPHHLQHVSRGSQALPNLCFIISFAMLIRCRQINHYCPSTCLQQEVMILDTKWYTVISAGLSFPLVLLNPKTEMSKCNAFNVFIFHYPDITQTVHV